MVTQHPDRDRSEPARYAGEGGPDTDSWRCSCGHWRPVTGSYGCADCGDGQPDSWDRIEDPATQPPADSEGSAEPLSEVVVSNALDEAWLESNDARGVARPPDLARHLHDALNDYVAIEATERAASPVADSGLTGETLYRTHWRESWVTSFQMPVRQWEELTNEQRILWNRTAAALAAAAPPAAGLDVERLIRAIEAEDKRLPFLDAGIDSTATPRAVGAQIAARYLLEGGEPEGPQPLNEAALAAAIREYGAIVPGVANYPKIAHRVAHWYAYHLSEAAARLSAQATEETV